jgi:predicted nucleic acid-binding protein
MKKFVLDTSAIFSLIESEAGKERVAHIIREEEILIPFVSLLELHYISSQEQGEEEANRRLAILKQKPILWQFDEVLLSLASNLKANHHISLADAMIAAVCIRFDAILVHKDPEYDQLSGLVELESLPYKT